MKKRISLLLLLSIVALLGLFVAPAAYSQPVEGTFDYNYETVYQEEAHGNTILYALEHENWTGSFEGKAHAVFIVFVNEAGAMTVDLFSTFTGTVDDKSGSLVIHLIGDKPSPEEDWFGDWDIVRGTGELVVNSFLNAEFCLFEGFFRSSREVAHGYLIYTRAE